MERVIERGGKVKGRVGRELWVSAFIFSGKLFKDNLEIPKIGSIMKPEIAFIPNLCPSFVPCILQRLTPLMENSCLSHLVISLHVCAVCFSPAVVSCAAVFTQ